MDLTPLKDAFDRVSKKQKLHISRSQEIIKHAEHEIEKTIAAIRSGHDHKPRIIELQQKFNESSHLDALSASQKEVNIALSKCLKLLEKTFNPDISKACRNLDFDTRIINQIIASHLYREGLFDVGDCFLAEAGESASCDEANKSAFLEMHLMLEALKCCNLEPALRWAVHNSCKLRENGSDLLLKLHRLQFIEMLKTNKCDALAYARTHIAPFSATHFSEIQKIMACILWAGHLDRCPYPDILSPENWSIAAKELVVQFCSSIGLPQECPLSTTVAAGFQSLPYLLKFMSVMAGKKIEWQTMKQLPVPVELGREFQFHSVFVCPVSKEQSTEDNPPMLMPCGHVLCMQSINKMSKNGTKSFKCPYCPADIDTASCRQLHF